MSTSVTSVVLSDDTDTPDLWSGGSGQINLFRASLPVRNSLMDTVSPRQGGIPAQAEGSMPEGLRNLYGASEQDTEQVKMAVYKKVPHLLSSQIRGMERHSQRIALKCWMI